MKAFALPGRIVELAARLRAALASVLPEAGDALRRHLPDAEARASLREPIAANIMDTLAQLQSLLEREFPAGLLESGAIITKQEVELALKALN